MLDWRKLVHLTDEELGRLDIAEVNLACAEGLPGSVDIDHRLCMSTLDRWTDYVRKFTYGTLPWFYREPDEYKNSVFFYLILCMVTALQRDLGLRYNPAKIPEDVPFDTADTFIHGAVLGDGGTCATIPVVYTAIGRRLGYPLKLVAAKTKSCGHLLCRWDDPGGERFNIEAVNQGLNTFSNDYYRTGRYAITPAQEEKCCLLKSKQPREELACFLAQRGHRFRELGRHRPAAEAFTWALALHPDNRMYWNSCHRSLNEWHESLGARVPPNFPGVRFRLGRPREFPVTMPENTENDYHYCQVLDNLLNTPDLERRYWGPMRRGLRVPNCPADVVADFHDFECTVCLHVLS